MDSRDRLVVVTGAAHGIGRAIARRLATDGFRLMLWDLDSDGLQECASLCEGADVRTQSVDISRPEVVAEAAAEALRWGGAPYGLVNNAGIFPRASLFEADVALWEKVLGINLVGTFSCTQAFAGAMLEQGDGAIVNMSSGLALEGAPRGAHYAASKAGLMALTKSLALELAPTIRVNCILPGITDTAQPLQDMSREEMARIAATIPLRRVGNPVDIAAMAAFLLSSDSSYVTGQSLSVCGGALMVA